MALAGPHVNTEPNRPPPEPATEPLKVLDRVDHLPAREAERIQLEHAGLNRKARRALERAQ